MQPSWHSSALCREHCSKNAPSWGDWTFWASTTNSLGAEVIGSKAGIVNLQKDISIVHGGCEDLQMQRAWVIGQMDITSQTSVLPVLGLGLHASSWGSPSPHKPSPPQLKE